ncbi:Amyloid-beta-like protein [Nymphon striatum]|nr:Amyloid-beta-like protein [Nymphon striatum]
MTHAIAKEEENGLKGEQTKHALAANYDSVTQQHPQLFVATICDDEYSLLNQYMNEQHQWVSDKSRKATCMKNKADILKYCQKVYPKRDIRNIVESTHHFTIDNWCHVDGSKCGEHHVVRPYRCLEGDFESDALLVPQQCVFDHIHKPAKCEEFEFWNGAASKRCYSEKKILRSFAMLKPCGIGIFSGVEFVCCPKEEYKLEVCCISDLAGAINNHLDDRKTPKKSSDDHEQENEIEPEEKSGPKKSIDKASPEYYFTHFDSKHEHGNFQGAQKKLEEIQHDKITDVMKEWDELNERYQEMKNKDPKGAENFKKETTKRFQKTVKALEDEQIAEKSQINSMHQQRVSATLNLKKKEGMNCFVKSLDSKIPKPKKIQKCLQKLVRALEKDRRHTLKHYNHMLSANFEEAVKMNSEVLDHLDHINKVFNQSMEMLEKYPASAKVIKKSIRGFWIDVRNRLESDLPTQLMASLSRDEDEQILQYYRKKVQAKLNSKEERKELVMKRKQERKDDLEEKHRLEAVVGHKIDKFDPETMEDESVPVNPQSLNLKQAFDKDRVNPLKISHYQHNKVSQDEVTFSVRREEVGSTYVALTNNIAVALAFVGVAVVVVIVVGVGIVRRRNRRSVASNNGFIEVDQAATPEERHVANMQVNGYENPTYKYFEAKN